MKLILKFLLILTLSFIPFLTSAQPKIEIVDGIVQYAGVFYPSDHKYIHEIEIANHGDYDLEIYSTESDCGCTNISSDDSTIPPGESKLMRFSIDTGRFSFGPNATTINFFTNDPVLSDFDFVLNYDYLPAVSSDKMGVSYGPIKLGENKQKRFELFNHTRIPLVITKLDYTDNRIVHTLNKGDTILPLGSLMVEFGYKSRRVGRIEDSFGVHFNHPYAEPLYFNIDGVVIE